MKNVGLILLVCLLHISCKGQTYFDNTYKTGFRNFYTTNIFSQEDSSFVAFNYVQDSATGRQDLVLLKIDKNGSELLKKKHLIINEGYPAFLNGFRQFIPATPSSFFATSATYTGNVSKVYLTKINKETLDTIKNAQYFDGSFYYYLNNFVKINDNKYFLMGNKTNTIQSWPVILELDSNLNVYSNVSISNPINVNTSNAIINPLSKRFIFSGPINFSNNQSNIGIIEADSLGVFTNSLILNFSGKQYAIQLKYSPIDNSYVFCGVIQSSQYGNNSMMRLNLTKINASNLSVIWSKTYGSASVFNCLYSMKIGSDGSIVTCGRYSDSTSLPLMNYDTKGVIIKAGSNGDSIWMRQYNNHVVGNSPTNYQETFFGIDKTLDGGYILCGNVFNQPGAKAWIVKTDSAGCIYSGCGSVMTVDEKEESLNEDEIKIYPNPARDFVYLKINNARSQVYSVAVTDISGKILIRKEVVSESKIDVSSLAVGIYFITVHSGAQRIRTTKLIVAE